MTMSLFSCLLLGESKVIYAIHIVFVPIPLRNGSLEDGIFEALIISLGAE